MTTEDEHVKGLVSSMKYSLFAGGKRLRPGGLIYSSYGIFEGFFDKVTPPFSAAVEMLHTYSLIHDDLPAMDDDDSEEGRRLTIKFMVKQLPYLQGGTDF